MFSLFSAQKSFNWPVTLDMHAHLLPGIDDGSPHVQTSVEMIRRLCELGYKHLIATPHVFAELYPNTVANIKDSFAVLTAAMGAEQLPVTLGVSAEYLLDDSFFSYFKNGGELLPLKDKTLLTEFSFLAPPVNLKEISFALITEGYKLILAHPERYPYYHKDVEIYHRLHDLGFRFQLNILSLTAHYGPQSTRAARYLLKYNLYDYLGTDLHHHQHLDAMNSPSNHRKFSELLTGYTFKNDDLLP